MIRKENAIERALQDTADAMCLAAKTAPKACGKDSVEELPRLKKESGQSWPVTRRCWKTARLLC